MIFALRAAIRGLRRSPGFTLAAVFTLALGIGADTAMFSVVNGVLLRPLPGYETGRLMNIVQVRRGVRGYMSPDLFLRLRDTLLSFSTVAANQNCRMNFTGKGEPEQLAGPCATANWFELQRAQAMVGRTFLPGEDQRGRNRVVVLDHGWWLDRFGGDRSMVGAKLLLDGEPWVVIGVMPPGFVPAGAGAGPVYTPYVVEDNPHGLNVTARLKPGVALASAQSELDVAAERLARESADWKDVRLLAIPVLEQMTGAHRPLLSLLLAAVSMVLMIACANVAGLLMARSLARRHEMDIRVALGARRSHLAGFILAEAAAIAIPASLVAVGVAHGALRLLSPVLRGLPRVTEIAVDVRVLGWCLICGTLAALLSGFLPACFWTRRDAHSRTAIRWQRLLVAAQVALAFVLVTGAGLTLRTLGALRVQDLGYDPRNVLTSFLTLTASADGTRTAGVAQFERIRTSVQSLPGVVDVATASAIPMFGVTITMDVHPEGEPERRHEHAAAIASVSESYFHVMRIPLRKGRIFGAGDREGAPPVAIVSAAVAARYFRGDAVERRIILPEMLFNIDGGNNIAAEIIGVVGNVCVNSVRDCDAEHIYLPERQAALRMENLLVRTSADPKTLLRAVRHALYEAAPSIPVEDPRTLEERAGYLSDDSRQAAWLLGVFGTLALGLGAAGVYGLSAQLAALRRKEIGIRMAAGATGRDIARMLYLSLAGPALAGIAAGFVGAMVLSRFLKSLLFGVSPNDPRALVWAGLALGAAVLLAALPAAAGAARTDPARVLRGE